MLMQGVHQKSELIFTTNLSLFPQAGPAKMEAHSGDSVEGLASSLFFHSASQPVTMATTAAALWEQSGEGAATAVS